MFGLNMAWHIYPNHFPFPEKIHSVAVCRVKRKSYDYRHLLQDMQRVIVASTTV